MAEEFISVLCEWEVIYLLKKLRINVVKLSDNVTEVRGPYFHLLFSLGLPSFSLHRLDSCSIFLSTRGEQAETSTLCALLRAHLRKHTCDFQSSLSGIHCITKHYNVLLTFLQFKSLNFRWLETVTLLAEVLIVCMCSLFRTWNPKLSPVDPHRMQNFSEIYRPIISKTPISLQ